MSKIASDDILESLYNWEYVSPRNSKLCWNCTTWNHQKLKTMEKRRKIREFDYETLTPDTGEVKQEQWSRIERDWVALGCTFRHESNDRAQKTEHNAATPSEPSVSRSRSVSRKRSIRGKSKHFATLRQPCRYYLKGTCTRSPCEYWHPPECHFYKSETGCKAEDWCFFPHHEVDEQPNKKPNERLLFPHKKWKRRQECCGYCENCTTIGLRLARFGSVGFSKWKNSHRETRCKKSWDQFEKYLRYVKQVSRKRKDHRQEKYKLKILISEVPTLWNLRTGPMKRLKDNSDAFEARHGTLPKHIYKLKEKDKATFYSPAEEWVPRAASTKELEEREFVVDSGASMHMVSKRDLNSAELETLRTSRSPKTVMTPNGEVQAREEATVCVKELDLFVTVMLLEESPAVLSLGKLCEDHGFSYHWTSGQKPHLTQNGKVIDCNFSNWVPFVVPGSSASSSSTKPSPISPSSSSQDSVFYVSRSTESAVPEISGSVSDELQRNPLHKSTETENKK